MGNNGYSEKLRHGRWQERRLEILKRDNFKCTRCGSQEKLQVHHGTYYKRREVWQYQDKDLTTFCDACHFNEHFKKPIAPAKIWEGIIDNVQDPITTKVLRLQELLKKPLSDEDQETILIKIMALKREQLSKK